MDTKNLNELSDDAENQRMLAELVEAAEGLHRHNLISDTEIVQLRAMALNPSMQYTRSGHSFAMRAEAGVRARKNEQGAKPLTVLDEEICAFKSESSER